MDAPEDKDLIEWAVATLKIPRGFFDSIFDADDWTFVIKIHGLIEAAMNHLLVAHFQNDNLLKIISRLPTSDPQTGKFAFIKACHLLPDITLQFVTEMSKLRNKLVHDLSNFGLTIPAYVSALDSNQLPNWRTSISGQFHIKQGSGKIKTALDFVDHSPREAIFTSMLYLLQAAQAMHEEQGTSSRLAESTPKGSS